MKPTQKLPLLRPGIYAPILLLLLVLVGVMGGYLWHQQQIIRDVEERSEIALDHFLQDETQSTGNNQKNVDLYLQNVRFHWSDKVFIDVKSLNARAIPHKNVSVVDFDNLQSFVVELGQADILILPDVLEGMFNESVFNYPGSKLRNLSVKIAPAEKNTHKIKLSGSINYLLWIPFEMLVDLKIDEKTNTLVMTVDELNVFGFIPATPVIELKPFNLDKIMTIPKNKHLTVHHNQIMIKPFGLFPPPRVTGKFEKIAINSNHLVLSFTSPQGVNEAFGKQETRNVILIKNGRAGFINLTATSPDIAIIDAEQKNPFIFYMLDYKKQLPASTVKINPDYSMTVTMPDGYSQNQ